MTAVATAFAAGIAFSAALGLFLTSRALEGREKLRRGMFNYYTNLSNAFTMLYHGLLLLPGGLRAVLLRPWARLAATLCIFVTFLIYFFVLTRCGREERRLKPWPRAVGNVLVHYVVPLLTLTEWFATAAWRGLRPYHALYWLALPLAYLIFIVLRGRTGRPIERLDSAWPYPFMDMTALGLRKWCRNIALVMLAFVLLGAAFAGLALILQ